MPSLGAAADADGTSLAGLSLTTCCVPSRSLRSAPFDEGAPSTAVSPASDNRWFDQSLLELGEGKYLTPALSTLPLS